MLISYAKQDELMRTLIELLGSQAAVAKALKVRKQKFYYWLTEAKHGVPYEQLLRMEALLKKCLEEKAQLERQRQIREGTLWDSVSLFDTPGELSVLTKAPQVSLSKEELSISQRVKVGIAHEQAVGNHQGERKDLSKELCQTSGEVFSSVQISKDIGHKKNLRDLNSNAVTPQKTYHERKNEYAAKLGGFSNVTTYVQAKKVLQFGCVELVKAMDEKKIAIDLAARLAKEPEAVQEELLKKTTKTIRAYFKDQGRNVEKKETSKKSVGSSNAAYFELLYTGLASLLLFNQRYKPA